MGCLVTFLPHRGHPREGRKPIRCRGRRAAAECCGFALDPKAGVIGRRACRKWFPPRGPLKDSGKRVIIIKTRAKGVAKGLHVLRPCLTSAGSD